MVKMKMKIKINGVNDREDTQKERNSKTKYRAQLNTTKQQLNNN
tara:strand:+ start:375 stop:506 length:132 start_codon:yes stop_codon:yes gene_type:complete